MSVSTLLRNINGEADIKFVYSNGYTNRLLEVGSSWQALRIGFRYCIDPLAISSNQPAPPLYIGLNSGAVYPVTSGSCVNFVGVRLRTGIGLTWHAGPPAYFTPGFYTWDVMKKLGSTITQPTGFGASYLPAAPASIRNALIFEFTKGSPNWSLAQIGSQDATRAQTDVSLTTMQTAMEAATMAAAASALGAGYANDGSASIAFDEVAGSINAVNIAWGTTTMNFEVSEMLVSLITP